MVTYIVSSDTQVILNLLRHFVFLNLLDLKCYNRLMKPTFQVTLDGVKPWPSLSKDALDYLRSCHICQIKSPSGKDHPAPYQSMPLIVEPFSRVVIDLVGPLPLSSNRFEYILTLIDVATRYAEAVLLKRITAIDVADRLFSIFTRLGFPLRYNRIMVHNSFQVC
ncbi:gypsy retrotransposon integrase-like protein 1 [Plakobranchus ocellatus]|uniref:Gypsy retrotransposon integrase-like protein 1 n=1 Tax=Plakobranchus ocellatus TaxID=259542 RepID=A0AAV3Z5N4_9GAST|nr:gypsy retrotransposon integrase-like protein 1 [Plakobranchus ocellatus]